MNYIKEMFSNKKFRYGAFSTVTTLVAVAILIVVNLVFSQLDIRYDLTADKIYSISQDSIDILKEIDEPITLYALYPSGEEIQVYKEVLEQYSTYGNNISIVYRDPYLYPQFVESYVTNEEAIAPHSVIVVSDKRHKVVHAEDLVTYTLNQQTYQYDLTSVDIEPQITNAIKFVTEESVATIYAVTGHNENPIPDSLIKQIDYANFQYENFDLFLADSVPEDCDILLVTTPGRDWTATEAEIVKEYLENEGRAMFFIDYLTYNMTNLESVLSAYGIEMGKAVVVEGDLNNVYYGNPLYLVPLNQQHDITDTLISRGYRTLLPMSRNVEIMSVKRNSLTFEPILTTSASAYGKTNPNSESINKEEGDLSGPFNLVVAVTDSYYTDRQYTAKLLVAGTSAMLDSTVTQYIGGTNADFFINAANWLYDKSTSVYIRSKSLTGTSLVMTSGQANFIALVSVIVIPVAIFTSGVVVWHRRRNR